MNKGRLVVISAPSGAGKTTICRRLQQASAEWRFSVSGTTRPQRPTEVDGVDYHFMDDDTFDRLVAQGDFIEWEWVHGHRYGTTRASLDTALAEGRTLLLDVDVKGGVAIMQRYPEQSIGIFINPPNEAVLAERLKARGTDSAVGMARRLERLPEEMAYKQEFDYVVVNDDLETAINQIETILRGE
ncbi:MAG: guanylate kinase [Candidatus Neomarinimicrobiota bacterium]